MKVRVYFVQGFKVKAEPKPEIIYNGQQHRGRCHWYNNSNFMLKYTLANVPVQSVCHESNTLVSQQIFQVISSNVNLENTA